MNYAGMKVNGETIANMIESTHFVPANEAYASNDSALKLVTIGSAVLKNGWVITDQSACIYPQDYHWERGVAACRAKLEKKVGDYLAGLIREANGKP